MGHEFSLLKKITNTYTIVIDGKRYIQEGSIPSVIETVRNDYKQKKDEEALLNKWID